MTDHAPRLAALRRHIADLGLDGVVVPLTDEHMSEYVGAYARRLEWLTGFKGSAGSAVILADRAAMLTDGRYTIQVREQVSGDDYAYADVPAVTAGSWLAANAPAGARIGYDPWLHTRGWVAATADALRPGGGTLVALDANPVDAVWPDRPAPSDAPAAPHDDALAGATSAEKRGRIADWLGEVGADAAVLSALDSIAWTFNLRGADVDRTPVARGYATVHADGTADLFMDAGKVPDALVRALGNTVRIRDYAAFPAGLAELAGRRVAVDAERSVAAVFDTLDAAGARVCEHRDPTVLPRARKTPAEIAGQRTAQAHDGAAMARFLRWVEGAAAAGGLTELAASDHLAALRREHGAVDLSFDAISAAGPHSAIPHYKADEASNAVLAPGTLYLIDSGGQWHEGTTDITRVIPVGAPTDAMRDRFTRVLQGHIAVATAVFPDGTTGGQIDAFARRPLWAAGLDYAHGTGHGVGAYLSVHEGPQRIAKPDYPGSGPSEPLRAGMILSNEPGYYRAGHWGIRIENLLLVEPRDIAGGEGAMLGFETLTFAPIERSLIHTALLDAAERAWVDAYHADVLARIGPLLGDDDRAWLAAKCAPLAG